MGIKRTANMSAFKKARATLERIGEVEGTPESLPRKLGYDGSWSEFVAFSGAVVVKTDIMGRYIVRSANEPVSTDLKSDIRRSFNPEIFAMCASTFLLGEGDIKDFEPMKTTYDKHAVVLSALANEIDPVIGAVHIPFEQGCTLVYEIDKSLYARSDGTGEIEFYGR
jgi:hypothetical protein